MIGYDKPFVQETGPDGARRWAHFACAEDAAEAERELATPYKPTTQKERDVEDIVRRLTPVLEDHEIGALRSGLRRMTKDTLQLLDYALGQYYARTVLTTEKEVKERYKL
jgi:hypothetical protein